jgi:hypothetical protein
MGTARHKLNVAYFNGAVIIAALIGMIAGSWAVFWIALAVLFVGGIYAGYIRPQSRRR